MKKLTYKVRETMEVTEESLTDLINEMIKDGYEFDGMHFAIGANSKRPSMCFLLFYRHEIDNEAGADE